MIQKRQTAYKVWISNLINSQFIKQEGEWDPNYVEINSKKISRVNLVANVVAKQEGDNFVSITLDDGSGTIRAKTWREDTQILSNIEVGDIISTVSRVREYGDEIFLTPELIRKVEDLNWELVHKLCIIKELGKPEEIKVEIPTPVIEETLEETPTENNRKTILDLVEKLDAESGADIDDVIKESKISEAKAESVIQELLKEGEIFECSPNRLKIIS